MSGYVHVIEDKLRITFEKYDKADFTEDELRLIKKMAKEFEASVRKDVSDGHM